MKYFSAWGLDVLEIKAFILKGGESKNSSHEKVVGCCNSGYYLSPDLQERPTVGNGSTSGSYEVVEEAHIAQAELERI